MQHTESDEPNVNTNHFDQNELDEMRSMSKKSQWFSYVSSLLSINIVSVRSHFLCISYKHKSVNVAHVAQSFVGFNIYIYLYCSAVLSTKSGL